MNNLEIRGADSKIDIDGIYELLVEFQKYLDAQNGVENIPNSAEKIHTIKNMLSDLINSDDTKIFVAISDSRIIGFAYLYLVANIRRGYKDAHLQDLFVSDSSRGNNAGSKLFDTVKSYCKENNISTLKLTSDLSLVKAHAFYEKNGGKFTEKLFRFDC